MAGVTFLRSTARIFDLSLGMLLWSRRTVFMALLVCGPVMLAAAARGFGELGLRGPGRGLSGDQAFGLMFWLFYVRFIVPVLAVFHGTALIADEVDDKTITYLFARPVRRGAVLVGKYLAYLVATALVVLPSLVLVYLVVVPLRGGSIATEFPNLVTDVLIVLAGLVAYGAVFAFVGARFNRPLVTGLVFLFGWEPAVLLMPGALKRLTVMHYVQSLVPHAFPTESSGPRGLQVLFRETLPAGTCVFALVLIAAGFLWWAVRTVEQREYVLEQ